MRSSVILLFGDAEAEMQTLPDQSVRCCVTSPPYFGLRSYLPDGHSNKAVEIGSEASLDAYLDRLVAVFREVRRVLTDDGTLWINVGDSYASSGTPGMQQLAALGERLGTGGGKKHSAMPAGRASTPAGMVAKNLIGVPWRLAFALQADGWILRQDIIWHKPNPMPESVTDRCTKSHEYVFLLSKSPRYYFDQAAINESSQPDPRGDGLHNGYAPVGQEPHRGSPRSGVKHKMPDGWDTGVGAHGSYHRNGREKGGHNGYLATGRRNRRSVWTISTQGYPAAHYATFPEKLVEPCILASTEPGDTILDPFIGSGTTAKVAIRHGRRIVGIDLDERNRELIEQRIQQYALWEAS